MAFTESRHMSPQAEDAVLSEHFSPTVLARMLQAKDRSPGFLHLSGGAQGLAAHLDIAWLDRFLSAHDGQLHRLVKVTLNQAPWEIATDRPAGGQHAQVLEALSKGATIKIEQLELRDPLVSRICLGIEAVTGAATYAKLFLTPSGMDGYPPHRDGCDVLVVQLAGEKRWTLYPTPDTVDADAARVLSEQERSHAADELRLAAADVLFLDAGLGHGARCEGAYSLHLSIGIETPAVWQVLQHWIAAMALHDPRLRARLPRGDPHHAQRLREAVAALGPGIQKVFESGNDPVGQLRRARDAVRRPGGSMASVQAVLESGHLTLQTRVRRSHSRNVELVAEGSHVRLYYTGSAPGEGQVPPEAPYLALPSVVHDDLRSMLDATGADGLAVKDFAGELDPESKLVLAKTLFKAGILELARQV